MINRKKSAILTTLLAVCAGMEPSKCSAVPVTFAFDANVVEVTRSANGTFDLPFIVNPGDTLNGILQFEEIQFGQSGNATTLQLNLASETFSADDVPMVTFNNYLVPISGSSVGGIFDGINVGCSTPSSCAGATSSLNGITIDQIRLGLDSGDIQSLVSEIASPTARSGIDLIFFLLVGFSDMVPAVLSF